MPYQLQMKEDGILWIGLDELLEEDVESFIRDFTAYLEAATAEKPLRTYTVNTSPTIKYPTAIRKMFATLNSDARLGKSATVGINRYARVLVGFVLKATGRDNIGFFDSEEEALAWLKEGR
jgi:hypothetical protein